MDENKRIAAIADVGTDLLKRLFGPAADEAGEWMADWVRSRRIASLTKALRRAATDQAA